jgi:Tol biopolymer transport system component
VKPPIAANGSDPRPFQAPGGQPVSPRWSPDGSSIAFNDVLPSGQGESIYVLTLADGTSRLITETSSRGLIRWSPDGTEIAYTRDDRHAANVWAVSRSERSASPDHRRRVRIRPRLVAGRGADRIFP